MQLPHRREARLPLCSRVHVRLTGYTVHANASRRQQNHVKVCTSVLALRQAGGWMVPQRSRTSVVLLCQLLAGFSSWFSSRLIHAKVPHQCAAPVLFTSSHGEGRGSWVAHSSGSTLTQHRGREQRERHSVGGECLHSTRRARRQRLRRRRLGLM